MCAIRARSAQELTRNARAPSTLRESSVCRPGRSRQWLKAEHKVEEKLQVAASSARRCERVPTGSTASLRQVTRCCPAKDSDYGQEPAGSPDQTCSHVGRPVNTQLDP